MSKSFNCFILAAGYGERLQPITNFIPKPLLPILGKPLLESIIEKIIALPPDKIRIDKIGINLHHKKEAIQEWTEKSPFNARIVLFPETSILNTGGALKNAESFLAGSDFIVHNGDIISDIDIPALAEYHHYEKNLVTLAVHDYPQFNNVVIDRDGLLKRVGKTNVLRDGYKRAIAFTGIAAYSEEFLSFLPKHASSIIDAWMKAAASGHRIGTFDVTGCSWSDIGSPSSYVSAVILALRNDGEAAHIAPSTLGCEDVHLDGKIVIENGCTLGKGSSLKNCVVLPNGCVESGATYSNCIVGPDYVIPIDESAFLLVTDKGTLIGTGGSDRSYFRTRNESGTVVFMQCRHEDPDFSRHIEYTAFFRKYSIPIPEMFGVDLENRSVYFEDLGDLSLYTWLKCPRCDRTIEEAYRRVIDILVQLHCEASEHVSDCPALADRIFDYAYLRWETDYFTERFVKGLKNIEIGNASSLADEFHRLALRTGAFTKRIIHRDFQSQNIMMTKGGIPRIIDYQGARMAPPAYDVASILWDPYAPLRDDLRGRLLVYYKDRMTEKSGTWFKTEEFAESLLYCRLQRHMQALGAYGFLSTIKGKTYYLKHVPEGLRLLKEETDMVKEEYSVLHNLVAHL
jgi:NDP-sugar pyrophosphorylase family protein/aminoglycoside/choline kinase family phosphotransferase